MFDEAHFNGLKSSDLISERQCSVCKDKFKPEESYFHRCADCQRTINKSRYDYECEDYEYGNEPDGFDLNVDWYKS